MKNETIFMFSPQVMSQAQWLFIRSWKSWQ